MPRARGICNSPYPDKIICPKTLFFHTFWSSFLLYTSTSRSKRHFDKISVAHFIFFYKTFAIPIQTVLRMILN